MWKKCLLILAVILVMGIPISEKTEAIKPQQSLTGHMVAEKLNESERWVSLGEFRITFYNGRGGIEGGSSNCFGEPLKDGMIAVDPDVIPLNSVVMIDGKKYRACDVGGMIKNKSIDIYKDVSTDALNKMGVKYLKVKVRLCGKNWR